MDVLRACYQTKCRFFTDSDLEIDIRWYFAKPGAKIFPTFHRFGSGNYASDLARWPGVGEVQGAPRPFMDGKPPPFDGSDVPGYDGKKFAGPLQVYQEGVAFPGIALGTNDVGQCPTCFPIPLPCDGFQVANPILTLRITAVRTTNPEPFGVVGATYPLTVKFVCGYDAGELIYEPFDLPFEFVFIYDPLVSAVSVTGDVLRYQYGDSQNFAPTFKAIFTDFPFAEIFSPGSLDPADEVWDFEILA